MDAILLAGTTEKDKIRFGMNKSLLKIGGFCLVEIVANALRGALGIDRIFLVTDLEDAQIPGAYKLANAVVKPHGGAMESVVACINQYTIGGSFLGIASDLPFISPRAIEDFVSNCKPDCQLNYGIVSKKDFTNKYPNYRKTFFKLEYGAFTSGNIFVADAAATVKMLEFTKAFFSKRKSPFQLASLMGLNGLAKFLLGRLSATQIQKIFTLRTGYDLNIIKSPHPEIALDIDGADQLHYFTAGGHHE